MQDTVEFTCNVCGAGNREPRANFHREGAICGNCGANLRMRHLIHALLIGILGEARVLDHLQADFSIIGLGLSDHDSYARRLKFKYSYTNTYFDREPVLDITAPPPSYFNHADFLISSDVFEHVVPPADKAFLGAYQVLKPGGIFILQVPFIVEQFDTAEHFSNLHRYRIIRFDGEYVLINRTLDGKWEIFGDISLHGSDAGGVTLEMRQFALDDLLARLQNLGFHNIQPMNGDLPEYGIFSEPWSFPIIAQKPDTAPEGDMAALKAEYKALEQNLERQAPELANLHAALAEQEAQTRRVHDSLSWKAAAPLRWLGLMLRKLRLRH